MGIKHPVICDLFLQIQSHLVNYLGNSKNHKAILWYGFLKSYLAAIVAWKKRQQVIDIN